MNIEEKIRFFAQLMRCGVEISSWQYNAQGQLLSSNCPQEALFATAFSLLGCKERMLACSAKAHTPVVVGTQLGLIWGAAFERQGDVLRRIHVLGPVFSNDVSMRQVEHGLSATEGLEVSIAWKKHFLEGLYTVPTVQHTVFSHNVLMLHHCVTEEYLSFSELYPVAIENSAQLSAAPQGRDRHKIYTAEQGMLQMVRNGDLNYKQALSASMTLSNGVPVSGKDPLRQAKISVSVFCSLVCRAAIEGGLSPEEAYALGDVYMQSTESAKGFEDLSVISGAMYDDFIRRVNRCRTNPNLSQGVQKCVTYVEMHLTEKIRAADLALLAGYGEYYITRKFKEETGYCINDYIKFAKIERAKVLLRSTEQSVQEIADALSFATRSYFSQSFKQVVGRSPAQYRAAQG